MFYKVNIMLFSSLLNMITLSLGRWVGRSVGKWSVVGGPEVDGFDKTLRGLITISFPKRNVFWRTDSDKLFSLNFSSNLRLS